MIAGDARVKTFFDRDLKHAQFAGATWAEQVRTVIDCLPARVYVSFDIDGLSPDQGPGTGTPVPVGTYSPSYEIVCKWLAVSAGAGLTVVPYKGLSAVVTEIAGRQIPLGAVEPSGSLPLIRDGRLRAIAMATRERHALLPDTPTLIERGVNVVGDRKSTRLNSSHRT